MTPAWILDGFAALMLAVSAISAARLVAAQPWRRGSVVVDSDVSHLSMAVAMAGMLALRLTTLPDAAWEVVFALLIAWFAFRAMRDVRATGIRALAGGHCAPHLVHSAAMLYMFLALTAGGGEAMSATGGSSSTAAQTLRYPTLAFAFALILVGYSVWDLDQLPGKRYSLAGVSVSVAGAVASGSPAMAGGTGNGGAPGGGSGVRPWLLSPVTTVGCRIAMGVTMALMLFSLI